MVSDPIRILKQISLFILRIVPNNKRDACFALTKIKYDRNICQDSCSLWGWKGKSESSNKFRSELLITDKDGYLENPQEKKNLPHSHTNTCERIHS